MNNIRPEELKIAAWLRGRVIPNLDPEGKEYRFDDNGNLIQFSQYGNRNSPFGWEIDHIYPTSLGGLNNSLNVRPLHWRDNASHGGLLGQFTKGKMSTLGTYASKL